MKLWFQTHFLLPKYTLFVLHYTQNNYLKKDLYKAQNAYNVSHYEGGSRGGKGRLRMKKEDRGQRVKKKGECTAVFFPLRCHIGFVTTPQKSSRTDKRRCSHIHIKLSMYNCIERQAPLTTCTKTEFHLFITQAL